MKRILAFLILLLLLLPTVMMAQDNLSRADRNFAELVAAGLSDSDIAQLWYLSTKSVEKHCAEILGKLGIQSADELALLGFDKYSKVQVIAVTMQTGETSGGSGGSYTVWDSRTQSHQVYAGSSSGSSYQWHLMMTVSGGVLYGLSVRRSDPWLQMGTYLAKRTDKGFEVLYHDKKHQLRHETLYIMSEEPYAQK